MEAVEKRRREADLTDLAEPVLTEVDWHDMKKGVDLFNQGQFWESHEAWEEIWQRHSENSRIFFQGLIQVAAGLHQLRRGIYHGTDKHFRNALWKLKPFPPSLLGIAVGQLVMDVEKLHTEVRRLGRSRLREHDPALIPRIHLISPC